MTRAVRWVPFPTSPEQVEACLDMANEGPIAIERDGVARVMVTTVEDYERLVGLEPHDAKTDESR